MSKELIGSHSVHETLVRQTQIDAARIEELERDLDALQADNVELVAAKVCGLTDTASFGKERATPEDCAAAIRAMKEPE